MALTVPHILLRYALPAALGAIVGFLTLAYAISSEGSTPTALVVLLSPGLKIAELIVPARHESLAFTFGWFLRIAIGVNAAYYFLIFALLSSVGRRRT